MGAASRKYLFLLPLILMNAGGCQNPPAFSSGIFAAGIDLISS